MESGEPSSAALISSRLEALCVAQQVKRSSACSHPWPEFLPVIDVRGGRRTWGPRNYFPEEYASRSGKRWLPARFGSLGSFLLAAWVIAGTASRQTRIPAWIGAEFFPFFRSAAARWMRTFFLCHDVPPG